MPSGLRTVKLNCSRAVFPRGVHRTGGDRGHRLPPERKGRPVLLDDLPAIETAADIADALGAVTAAMAGGTISPDEGLSFAAVLELQRKSLEMEELAHRIAALGQAAGRPGR